MAQLEKVEYFGTHRLIPERYSRGRNVLETLHLPQHVLSELSELDAATKERKIAGAADPPESVPTKWFLASPRRKS